MSRQITVEIYSGADAAACASDKTVRISVKADVARINDQNIHSGFCALCCDTAVICYDRILINDNSAAFCVALVNINEVVGDLAGENSAYAGTSMTEAQRTRTLPDGTTVTLPAHTKDKIGAIGTVFGGGNAAKVVGSPTVKIGTEATVDFVTKAKNETTPRTGVTVVGADITGDVFGGGNQAEVTGNSNVTIGKNQ